MMKTSSLPKRSRKFDAISRLCEDMSELRERVSRLEQSLLRGLWLLLANLLGVVFSLIQQGILSNH
ncbi:MAG TPA: hypothetical protein PLX23_05150 [Candidatus Hydrogenedens sp.]|nr:hypothetical protein [Candidatus Hydrogenedens sp.]